MKHKLYFFSPWLLKSPDKAKVYSFIKGFWSFYQPFKEP